jgi:hypothetical protein
MCCIVVFVGSFEMSSLYIFNIGGEHAEVNSKLIIIS